MLKESEIQEFGIDEVMVHNTETDCYNIINNMI